MVQLFCPKTTAMNYSIVVLESWTIQCLQRFINWSASKPHTTLKWSWQATKQKQFGSLTSLKVSRYHFYYQKHFIGRFLLSTRNTKNVVERLSKPDVHFPGPTNMSVMWVTQGSFITQCFNKNYCGDPAQKQADMVGADTVFVCRAPTRSGNPTW